MDARPRRSVSTINHSYKESEYDREFNASLRELERRASSNEKDARKRKRESDSPKQFVHHTALRDGLRNSISTSTTSEQHGYADTQFETDLDHVAPHETMPHTYNNGRNTSNGHIVKLQFGNNRRSDDGHAGNGNHQFSDITNNSMNSDHVSLRRSTRNGATEDAGQQAIGYESDSPNVDHAVPQKPAELPESEEIPSESEASEESVENYQPRQTRRRTQPITLHDSETEDVIRKPAPRTKRLVRGVSGLSQKSNPDEEEYVDESVDAEDAMTSDSAISERDDMRDFVEDDEKRVRRSRLQAARNIRPQRRSRRTRQRGQDASDEDFDVPSAPDDLRAELAELRPAREERRRELRDRTNRPDYALPPPLTDQMVMSSAPSRKQGLPIRSSFRSLYPEYSNLGLGLAGSGAHNFGNFGPPTGVQSESDSSDEEGQTNKTAADAVANALLPAMSSLEQSASSGPSNMGKVKGANLADADPIGIDKNVNFESVGGLADHIDQLKEMVSLPLLYPEIFQRFHITPPRGVLFHGPPGTGKTLMARALAASCSTEGRKISFYMRKGADCLSKWVGEAERQLRLLFEEAKNNQPSIIFFDEIDGLAPVRSAKQDQIHASIVSTLLALMDGMDARGQVVVVGATNRPDSVDPALRRPGRFDREFYFPLPSLEARRHIISIHTNKWEPPLEEDFRAQLADRTKGYGGADLRALCTEAALNAVQRRYPQIYASTEKLVIDPAKINVVPRDFMLAIKKIIPSSARSSASGAAILPEHLQPLLGPSLAKATMAIDKIVPRSQKKTSLEENMSAPDDDSTFQKENMLQLLEGMRIFRPRILLSGSSGMGQQHIGRAILHYLEGFHVQNIDLAMMFSDSASTAEASLIQAFVEAKRHKPSVLFMPSIELWFATATDSVISTLKSLLSTVAANEPLLLLGIANRPLEALSSAIIDFFGHAPSAHVTLGFPTLQQRTNFFSFVLSIVVKSPSELPGAQPRRKRKLEQLAIAPPEPARQLSRAEKKLIETKDRKTKLVLKSRLGPLMELIRTRYKRFKKPAIDEKEIAHLLMNPEEDIPDGIGDRDYQRTDDGMILELSTGKKFFNMDINLIEERLWSNLYLTPKQFQTDVEQILHDAKEEDSDRDRVLKAQEMHTNVLIHLEDMFDATFLDECKAMALREVHRHKQYMTRKHLSDAEGSTTLDKSVTTDLPVLPLVTLLQDKLPSPSQAAPIQGSELHDATRSDRGDLETERSGTAEGAATVSMEAGFTDEEMSDVVTMPEITIPNVSNLEGEAKTHDPLRLLPRANTNGVKNDMSLSSMLAPVTSLEDVEHSDSLTPEVLVAQTAQALQQELATTVQDTTTDQEAPEESDSESEVGTSHAPYELDLQSLETMTRQWSSATNGLSVDQIEEINAAAIDAVWRLKSEWNRNRVAEAADYAVQSLAKSMRRSV